MASATYSYMRGTILARARRSIFARARLWVCLLVLGALACGSLQSPRAGYRRAASVSADLSRRGSAEYAGLSARLECPYSAAEISILRQFDHLIGRGVDCAQVFANTASTWAEWEKPWFVNYVNAPNLNWSAWATTASAPKPGRRLVVTLSLFPSSLDSSDWLAQGAAGDYTAHDKALARNLVAAGLGGAIIRLAPEMNGDTYPYSLGDSSSSWSQWAGFWRRTVQAMRSVSGAHFSFDWCVNSGYRNLPLAQIYPGDRYVDIVGMDVYDVGALGASPSTRWRTSYDRPDGIGAILDFARRHGKPVSIPEWGLAPTQYQGGGDNPTFVNGIAAVVRHNPVVYESYFYREDYQSQLDASPHSLAAYRRHFGAHGDSVEK